MVKNSAEGPGIFPHKDATEMFCRMRGYISTVSGQDENVFAALKRVLKSELLIPSAKSE